MSRVQFREAVAALAEAAINLLDVIDGDPDIEADEPDEEHDGAELEWPRLSGSIG